MRGGVARTWDSLKDSGQRSLTSSQYCIKSHHDFPDFPWCEDFGPVVCPFLRFGFKVFLKEKQNFELKILRICFT